MTVKEQSEWEYEFIESIRSQEIEWYKLYHEELMKSMHKNDMNSVKIMLIHMKGMKLSKGAKAIVEMENEFKSIAKELDNGSIEIYNEINN